MGTPIPIEPPPGEACALCDNILWLPGETPYYITATFTGITACPGCIEPPNDVPLTLTQRYVQHCQWEYIVDPWVARLSYASGISTLVLYAVIMGVNYRYFLDIIFSNCQTEFENAYLSCNPPSVSGIGGTAEIDLP